MPGRPPGRVVRGTWGRRSGRTEPAAPSGRRRSFLVEQDLVEHREALADRRRRELRVALTPKAEVTRLLVAERLLALRAAVLRHAELADAERFAGGDGELRAERAVGA